MKLSVVIPAYNEEADIKEAVLDVYYNLINKGFSFEIIVVNDASTDNTLTELNFCKLAFEGEKSVSLKVLTNDKNKGHGYSVIRGLWEAEGEYILYIDADRQIGLDVLFNYNNDKIEGFDFASGWRINRQDKLFRKVISFFLKTTIFFRFGYFIRDANCPFKIYRKDALLPLLLEVPESKIIPIACLDVLARKNNLKIKIVKTPHKPYRGIRKGFLQLPDKAFFKFCYNAFNEIIRL